MRLLTAVRPTAGVLWTTVFPVSGRLRPARVAPVRESAGRSRWWIQPVTTSAAARVEIRRSSGDRHGLAVSGSATGTEIAFTETSASDVVTMTEVPP
jgi:hypothetical protein